MRFNVLRKSCLTAVAVKWLFSVNAVSLAGMCVASFDEKAVSAYIFQLDTNFRLQ
jgi:hypothetical protein